MLLLVTLVAAVQVALAEDHLQPVPVIQLAIYFRTAVKMSHSLANQVVVVVLYANIELLIIPTPSNLTLHGCIHYIATDALEFLTVPSNVSVILGPQTQQIRSQFHCSVRASRVATFEWTFCNKSQLSSTQYQISDELGSVDAKYSVASRDYASTLTIEGIQFSDSGVYICHASIGGTVNPVEASAHLLVEGKSHACSIKHFKSCIIYCC